MFETIGTAWAPRILSLVRIVTGLLLLGHGIAKIFKFPAIPMLAKVDVSSILGVSGLLELVGGALLLVGLFSRPVAFILSGMCAVGYFMFHAPRSFFPIANNGDAIVLFAFILLYLAAAGPGPWSIDAARKG